MTGAVLVVGGITRLTHSGLSMVEWQPLMGAIPPLSEGDWQARFHQYQQFPDYQQLRPGLSEFKVIFLWEYLHRLLARAIGVVFLVPFVLLWRAGDLTRPLALRTLTILALGGAQGVMGWLMVRSGLVDRPSVSHYRLAAHLSLAFVIFALCVWLARELAGGRTQVAVSTRVRRLMASGLAMLGVLIAAQVVWGAFVAGLQAGRLFNTFPLMAGHIVPAQLLILDPPLFNFVGNAAAVQWVHRVLGTALLAASWLFFLRVRRARPDRLSAMLNRLLAAMMGAQYGLGIVTLVLGVPVAVAVLHQTMALAIVGVWVVWIHHVRNLAVTVPDQMTTSRDTAKAPACSVSATSMP
jgi:cytochrome c oxidase assembly protein subunit 15